MAVPSLPIIEFDSEASWQAWLEANHAASPGLWLKLAKKDQGVTTVTYAEALDVALCYGWIDGQKQAFDDTYWLQRFTPRGPKSVWSKVNTEHVERLIAAGRLQPAGLEAVNAAKADGRWERAYQSQGSHAMPDDLEAALAGNSAARTFFQSLSSANRYAIIYRVTTAKKPETRAARVAKFIEMLNRGEKIYPDR